jgi:predicted secreted protein
MAISITGGKYTQSTISSVGTTTVTSSTAAFVTGDFSVQRLVGLWTSSSVFKGMSWVRRYVSNTQLELQTNFFDPATGLSVAQLVGDIMLVSKNFTESVTTGLTVSGRNVTITDAGECIFGNTSATGVCFYDDSKEISTPGQLRIQGGLTVFGKLDSYSDNGVSSACDIYFTGSGSTLNTQDANSNFMMYGGVLSGPNSPLYIGGYQGTPGKTMIFNGVQNPFDFISPNAGGSWGANASRQQLVNCYSLTTSGNAIMRRWGDGKIIGGRYKFPNFTSAPISIFGSDVVGVYTVATPPNSRAVVLDMGSGPALVRSSGGAVSFDFTNLVTTDYRNVTGVAGSLAPNNSGINTFSFSETYTGIKTGTVGVIQNSSAVSVQSNASITGSWTPTLLRRTCVGATVTINSTNWNYGFKNYGYDPVFGTITPTTYDLGTAGLADNVSFGGAVIQTVDTAVTLSNSAALALISKFTASNTSNGTVTITANATLDELYDYLIAWGSSSTSLAIFPTLSDYPITANGTLLTTGMTISVNNGAILSGGVKFKNITSGGSLTITGNALSNITITGPVVQTIPTNLTNVIITGTLTHNTATNTNVIYNGSTLSTVNNSGAGVVTVKRVLSTLTNGTNVTSYLPTTLVFTLNGGRIRVLDNVGTEQYNQTTDGTFELPSSATGTWSYKIVKYGSKPIENTITIDGTSKSITASYIPDTFVVDTLANVQAYTTLGTTQKIYDYYSYYLTTASGIIATKNVTLTASLLDLGNNKLANTTLGVVGTTIGTNITTVSGVNILTSVLQTGITPTYPQKITDSGSTTNWVQLTLNGGRIRILDNVGTEQYNQTTDGNLLLSSSATGTWTYKIVKYGSQPITGSFNIDGTLKSITASYIPDAFVVDTLTNVQAYTTLGTTQKIYDYYSYYLSTATGILVTKGITLTASLLNLGAFTLSNTALNVSSNVIGINTTTISGVDITTTGTQTGITPSYPQRITDTSTSTNWVQVTLNGGRIRILDNTSTEQYNQTTDGNILLPQSSTGTWTYKIVKYGSNPIFGSFNIDGTLKSITGIYIPDTTVVDTLSNVIAYPSLGTSQKIYDWYSYYLTTLVGIRLTKSVSITSTLLNLGAYTLANSVVGITGNVIGINTSTVNGVSLTTTGTQTGITPIYPQQLTDSTGTTNWLSVVLTSGQVCRDTFDTIYHTASYNTFIPSSYVSAIDVYVSRVGYKKQVVSIPFSTVLYATKSFTLIPDSNVVDVVTDFTTATLTNSQNIYDAFSQYQASSIGILDTYTLTKSPGSIDFTSKGFELSTINDFTVNPIKIKSTNLTTDTYYSTSNFTQGSATLGSDVKIRALNLDSELIYTADSITFYPTIGDRNAATNPGITISGGIYRYKFGSTYTGVVMTNPTNIRYITGVTISLGSLPLVTGNYVFSLTPTELIIQTNNNLRLVNRNVIKTSLFIPSSEVF